MFNMHIKIANINDIPEIKELVKLGVNEGFILDRSEAELNNLVKNQCILISKEDTKLIGLICLDYYSDRLSEIRTVYVLKEYRGKGIGKELIHNIIEVAKKLGIKELMTITMKDKKEWFLNNGFAEETNSFKIALFKKFD